MLKTYIKTERIDAIQWTGDNLKEIEKYCTENRSIEGIGSTLTLVNGIGMKCLPGDYLIISIGQIIGSFAKESFEQLYQEEQLF